MKPLRKGAARTGLAKGLHELAVKGLLAKPELFTQELPGGLSATQISQIQAAVLGGAIEETLREMKIDRDAFWRYTVENLWRLTRALEASGLLLKAGE